MHKNSYYVNVLPHLGAVDLYVDYYSGISKTVNSEFADFNRPGGLLKPFLYDFTVSLSLFTASSPTLGETFFAGVVRFIR